MPSILKAASSGSSGHQQQDQQQRPDDYQKNTIYTNVCRNLDDNTVWWEGLDQPAPTNLAKTGRAALGIPETAQEKGAHPNSRFTAPAENCPPSLLDFHRRRSAYQRHNLPGGHESQIRPLICQSKELESQRIYGGSKMSSGNHGCH